MQRLTSNIQRSRRRKSPLQCAFSADFERAERARRDRERAINDLESLVFDTGVRLSEDDAFRETQFKDELAAIEKLVGQLRIWLDDEAHEANTTVLRSKHTSLVRVIVDKQLKERKLVEEAARKLLEAKKEAGRLAKLNETAAAAEKNATEANETAAADATDETTENTTTTTTTTEPPPSTSTDAEAERPDKEL